MTENKLIRDENEAIDCLKNNKPTSGFYMLQESVDMAIQALEEIQQYRAIGTVEELQALKKKSVAKSRIIKDGKYYCCSCNRFAKTSGHCSHCGQMLY